LALKQFDRKFGTDLVRDLPEAPGVYLFKDDAGVVLYAGKAKNLRRRLANYRSAGRKKAHRKMRTLVREAHSVEVRVQASEREALLLENELIRTLRPRYNVDGAFDFLYASVGSGWSDGRLQLCFTTTPEAYEALGLQWHGVFRSRARALDVFDALCGLLGHVGHPEARARLPAAPRLRGSRWVGYRRIPDPWLELIRAYFDGESDAFLSSLFDALLERRDARRDAGEVHEGLRRLRAFYRQDITRLRKARNIVDWPDRYVPSARRDELFIEARLSAAEDD
jgi:predicted GIY-YIG superfamily endonuclease